MTKGRNSSVCAATRCGLDRPGFKSRWVRDFPHPSRLVLVPTRPPVRWLGGYSGQVNLPGLSVSYLPHLALSLKKEYSCTSTPPLGLRGLFYGENNLFAVVLPFLLRLNFQTGSGAHPAPPPQVNGYMCFPAVQWQEREVDNSLSSSIEVKSEWSYTSTPPVQTPPDLSSSYI